MSNANITPTGEAANITLALPDECPVCKHKITPSVAFCINNIKLYNDSHATDYTVVFGCPACRRPFMGLARTNNNEIPYVIYGLEPQKPEKTIFDKALSNISPTFIDIYHQAQAAEAYNLTQISGMGYRKALEFLIKDFAKYKEPDKEENIIEMQLLPCISTYIDHPKIKATAIAATWIGNDESHYVRKWKDKDITDLKNFISSCVHFILADYEADEALKMIDH